MSTNNPHPLLSAPKRHAWRPKRFCNQPCQMNNIMSTNNRNILPDTNTFLLNNFSGAKVTMFQQCLISQEQNSILIRSQPFYCKSCCHLYKTDGGSQWSSIKYRLKFLALLDKSTEVTIWRTVIALTDFYKTGINWCSGMASYVSLQIILNF